MGLRTRCAAAAGALVAASLAWLPAQGGLAPADSPSVEDEWYLPSADGEARLYVWEVGRGDPVIVLHGGFGAEHSYLYDAVRGLSDRHRFVFYDQRGSLRSPCALEAVRFEAHVADLETLRAELGLERVSLFAHSMGTVLPTRRRSKAG